MNRFEPDFHRTHTVLHQAAGTAAVFLLAFLLLLFGTSSISSSSAASQTESLRLAITRSAVHCYATEGYYPESLSYIQEHYGISWNEDKYLVYYEITGSNRMPTVTVIPKS